MLHNFTASPTSCTEAAIWSFGPATVARPGPFEEVSFSNSDPSVEGVLSVHVSPHFGETFFTRWLRWLAHQIGAEPSALSLRLGSLDGLQRSVIAYPLRHLLFAAAGGVIWLPY